MPAKKAAAKKAAVQLTPDALEKLVNKRYGAGTMMRASNPALQITRIPTGILSLDKHMKGGLPRGRHIEIYGNFGICKTYVANHIIATAQTMGLNCSYLDAEGTWDPVFAAQTGPGVDLESLLFPPNIESGNRAIDLMEVLIRSETQDIIVLDSIAALLPKAELESSMEDTSYGTAQALLMSKAMRKLTSAMNSVRRKPILIYINQTRTAVGVMFGDPTVTSGGRAMGFYAGMRLELVRAGSIKKKAKVVAIDTGVLSKKDVIRGHRVAVRIKKDKTGGALESSQTTFVFDYQTANIDPVEDIIYCGLLTGMVVKEGSKWYVPGMPPCNGRGAFKRWLESDPEYLKDLEGQIAEADLLDYDEEDIDPEEEGEDEE